MVNNGREHNHGGGMAGKMILAANEPDPVERVNMVGASPFVLGCEHAGRRIPSRLGTLGLDETDRQRHIAWDIGAGGMSRRLATALDAPLILQRYSRLVIDCNRPLDNATLITRLSETTVIPGNTDVSAAERAARIAEIYQPFHDAMTGLLDTRARQKRLAVLVDVHSFTPVFKGVARPWHIGVMFRDDSRFANALAAEIAADPSIPLGINEPYALTPGTDYTALAHGQDRGLLHTEIEIRQDLIATVEGQAAWAERLTRWLPAALSRLIDMPT